MPIAGGATGRGIGRATVVHGTTYNRVLTPAIGLRQLATVMKIRSGEWL
jgi:hypothetical protein